jgi:SAM-dependent methyltransferase
VFRLAPTQLAFGVVPAHRRFELYQARYVELVPVVAKALAEKGAGLEVLDIGPGTGDAKKFVDALAGKARWTAVEVSPPYIEACRAAGYERIVDGVDLERQPLPLPDASYDVVIASHVLEHLENAPEALKDWVRVLRPGGHLLVGVPMHFGWLAALARLRYRLVGRRPRQHCLFFSMRTLRAFFRELPVRRIWGFRVVSARRWLPLEDAEWFYRASRWVGARWPHLTGEVIVHVEKPAVADAPVTEP